MKGYRLRMRALAIVLSLLAAMSARAQEPPDGPQRIFRDAFIDNLVGEWRLKREIRGRDVDNTVSADWVLNHQFLRIHMKDVAEPPTYEALVYIGYQSADQRYVVHWLDVFGGKFSAIGYGKREGDSITFVFQYDDGPFYNTFKWNAATQSWTFTLESTARDGRRQLFAVDTLRRE
jgi:hypothetical protein